MRDRRRPAARPHAPQSIEMTGVLLRGLRDALRGVPMKKSAKVRLMALGLIEKDPGRFSRLTAAGLRVLQTAQPPQGV